MAFAQTYCLIKNYFSWKKFWMFWTIAVFFSFPSEFFMPGLVDTHIHAPQYSFTGTRVDLPLLQWLTTYTFPTEAKFKDSDFAEEVYTRVVVSFSKFHLPA